TGYSNIYDHGGGGIADAGGSTFNGITVSANKVTGGAGGGFFGDCGSVDNINNSVISGNSTSGTGDYGGGGGVWSYCGTNISNTTVSGNSTAVNGSWAGGGGLWIDNNSAITGTTISGNKVTGTGSQAGGGGVYTYDDVAFMNDTISNNTSSIDGGGVRTLGSYNDSFINVTLYQNTATGNGGSIFNDNAGAPYVMIANSIAAGGKAASGKDVYNTGTIVSNDFNIIGTAAAGGGTFTMQTHDKTTDPKLLGLGNNGGPTFTNADQPTSPGKGYIPWSSASSGTCGNQSGIAVDQRAFSRGAGGKCDVGAYEVGGTPSLVKVHVHAKSSHHANPTHLRMHRHLHPRPPQ
ncbi:MAG TPA: choice-of-anchor Q domain-containing protein, partial [Candidatus Baltobacteraceae bacterium]|nr:choice-of-anchor Q domain-containing protein [Candidatus Baltobacteraceae bacterium]